ncbi:hypothetical protein COCCADRAFT_27393 [Bipolaris zeicola 26-R-13]|uniref:Uncharacterized protein n=1 Tax=Cochliobolus carbonum (strain 26-R-13) TaxID=930089 RepID=W6Y9A0_COCC2|nr:uncharacterized protein COCCADRAFT_27393 [Bipolaris zeicola 26-R-13]EUC31969.1 hypothetical protein COCCADRAFT_27393 [Bipolaris zeicola 26-R-13]
MLLCNRGGSDHACCRDQKTRARCDSGERLDQLAEVAADIHGGRGGSRYDDVGVVFVDVVVVVGVAISEDGSRSKRQEYAPKTSVGGLAWDARACQEICLKGIVTGIGSGKTGYHWPRGHRPTSHHGPVCRSSYAWDQDDTTLEYPASPKAFTRLINGDRAWQHLVRVVIAVVVVGKRAATVWAVIRAWAAVPYPGTTVICVTICPAWWTQQAPGHVPLLRMRAWAWGERVVLACTRHYIAPSHPRPPISAACARNQHTDKFSIAPRHGAPRRRACTWASAILSSSGQQHVMDTVIYIHCVAARNSPHTKHAQRWPVVPAHGQ